MIERLEITPGSGTVIRYGFVIAWASGAASPALVSFLAESARNLADSPIGGEQLADHLAGVLSRRDPEPQVPFVTVGPGEQGWAALLHGPVQIWDGAAWTTAEPHPGWIQTSLSPRPGLSVSVAGSPVASLSPDSLLDLEAGVVPGGGFVMLAARSAPVLAVDPAPAGPPAPVDPVPAGPPAPVDPAPAGPPAPVGPAPAGAETVVLTPAPAPPAELGTDDEAQYQPAREAESDHLVTQLMHLDLPGPTTTGEDRDRGEDRDGGEEAAAGSPAPPGVMDLHDPAARARVVSHPPLPPGGDPPRPTPGAPVVAGVPCRRGHVNRPGMLTCARCGEPITAESSYQVSGTRPALGCLITDRGAVYGLDSGYLVGADPAKDPTVRGRLARPLVLDGEDVAPSHAEVRLHDWDVVVTDRASEGGTHVYPPGGSDWERLSAYQPRVIAPGTHIALGQRVVTFVSPWSVPPPGTEPSGPLLGSGSDPEPDPETDPGPGD